MFSNKIQTVIIKSEVNWSKLINPELKLFHRLNAKLSCLFNHTFLRMPMEKKLTWGLTSFDQFSNKVSA